MSKRWGATPEAWAHFKKLAKVDLLPVVSNPHAEISPRSKMKSLGKTPSLYNQARLVSGFTDWTDHETTVVNIEAWSQEEDYGICLQTRRFRALDIDVADEAMADEIEAEFLELLGLDTAPTRIRGNSGKRLVLVLAEGELSKDAFPVKEWFDEDGKRQRWIVELLATGQQFIAVGTHTSGVDYEWRDGLPALADVPVVTIKRLVRAFEAIKEARAVETWKASSRHEPTLLEDLNVDDPVGQHLIDQGLVLGEGKGMLYVECPWQDGHSSDNGETQTAWLVAGSGKYRNGHFACRHAGCSGHTDADFLQAVEYRPVKAAEFEDLSVDDGALAAYEHMAPGASAKSKELKAERKASPALPLPGFNRDNSGRIETSLENLYTALTAPQAAECHIAFDDFRGELMLAERPGEWRSMGDADAVELRARLEALGFKDKIGKDFMRDALEWVGRDYTFDSAVEWLMKHVPPWDGVSRIARFWPDWMRTKDTRYTQALGNYSWTAQAARILDPGCQVDMVPVLVGPEGYRKTSALKALAPSIDFYGEFNLAKDDEKLARIMRGKLVGELAELRGISVRDAESVLSWITRTEEEWTPKFKEYNTKLKRRLLFYGTTNDPEFLQPHMGIRRWLPVTILGLIDTDQIVADLLQLWAEARDVYLCEGILFAEVEELAKAERDSFRHIDPWHDRVAKWLDEAIDDKGKLTPRNSGTLQSEQVLIECLGQDPGRIKKPDQMRVGEVLKMLGMKRTQRWIGGRNTKVWLDTTEDAQ